MNKLINYYYILFPVPNCTDSERSSLKDNFLFGKHDIDRRTPHPPSSTEPAEKRARNDLDKRVLGAGELYFNSLFLGSGGTIEFENKRKHGKILH